jgi:hypothetical protein
MCRPAAFRDGRAEDGALSTGWAGGAEWAARCRQYGLSGTILAGGRVGQQVQQLMRGRPPLRVLGQGGHHQRLQRWGTAVMSGEPCRIRYNG